MVFKIMTLDKFTKGINADREETLGYYNINSSGRKGGTSKRDRDSVARKAGEKPGARRLEAQCGRGQAAVPGVGAVSSRGSAENDHWTEWSWWTDESKTLNGVGVEGGGVGDSKHMHATLLRSFL